MLRNPITIESLQILDAIERRGSFAKAAEELNKVPSALSYVVQKLEEQLDVSLFTRQGRRSVLTAAGRVVLEDGRDILKATSLLASRAKEVATGWEPLIRIALESTLKHSQFFHSLALFLAQRPGIEVDVSESILSGGWDALEHDRVDLIVGAPGPVPPQKGYRAIAIGQSSMLPVIAAHSPFAYLARDYEKLQLMLPKIRRVVSHDTSQVNISRTAGLAAGRQVLYVQTMDQKIAAQRAGLGIGFLPRNRIQAYLDSGELIELALDPQDDSEVFLAWKISNKGKGLQSLVQLLSKEPWDH